MFQGIREIDRKGPKADDRLATANENKTNSRFVTSSSTPAPLPSNLNALHRAASLSPFRRVIHSFENHFIPCFGMLYVPLSVMNERVSTLSHYDGTGPPWIPQISVIYFSILAYVQVLRAQSLSYLITSSQTLFLESFLRTFPLETVEIPGPLVPFFRSLSVANPGFGNHRNVTPAIPPYTQSERCFFNLSYYPPDSHETAFDGITMMLPNIGLMMDQFSHLLNYLDHTNVTPRNKNSDYVPLSTIFGHTRPDADDESRTLWDRLRTSIGFWDHPYASDDLMDRFALYAKKLYCDFPVLPSVDSSKTPAQWLEITDFGVLMHAVNGMTWFRNFQNSMKTFNAKWKGNQLLSDISPISSAASLILYKGVRVSANTRSSLFGAGTLNGATYRLTYETYGTTTCPFICNEDEQDSQLAQVNIECDHKFNNDMTIGQIGTTLFGSYWSVSPQVRKTSRVDITPNFHGVICTSYFRDFTV